MAPNMASVHNMFLINHVPLWFVQLKYLNIPQIMFQKVNYKYVSILEYKMASKMAAMSKICLNLYIHCYFVQLKATNRPIFNVSTQSFLHTIILIHSYVYNRHPFYRDYTILSYILSFVSRSSNTYFSLPTVSLLYDKNVILKHNVLQERYLLFVHVCHASM